MKAKISIDTEAGSVNFQVYKDKTLVSYDEIPATERWKILNIIGALFDGLAEEESKFKTKNVQ